MSQEHKELMSKVELGIEVEAFMVSTIGNFLLDQLKAEAAGALEDLKTVNPQDLAAIIELQLVIKRSENIESWLAGLFQEGRHAEAQLKGEE